jgi:hypothetical protein
VAIVGELEATGVAKHVWVDREWHLGGLPDTLDGRVAMAVAAVLARAVHQPLDLARLHPGGHIGSRAGRVASEGFSDALKRSLPIRSADRPTPSG